MKDDIYDYDLLWMKDCCENRQKCLEHNVETMRTSSMREEKKRRRKEKNKIRKKIVKIKCRERE